MFAISRIVQNIHSYLLNYIVRLYKIEKWFMQSCILFQRQLLEYIIRKGRIHVDGRGCIRTHEKKRKNSVHHIQTPMVKVYAPTRQAHPAPPPLEFALAPP
jgi:hypothetical protein